MNWPTEIGFKLRFIPEISCGDPIEGGLQNATLLHQTGQANTRTDPKHNSGDWHRMTVPLDFK